MSSVSTTISIWYPSQDLLHIFSERCEAEVLSTTRECAMINNPMSLVDNKSTVELTRGPDYSLS